MLWIKYPLIVPIELSPDQRWISGREPEDPAR